MGVFWAIEKRWHPAGRTWRWLYRHTTAYRVRKLEEQLQKQAADDTYLLVLLGDSMDAQIKALQARIADLEATSAKYLSGTLDHSQEGRRIKQLAKDHAQESHQ